MIITATLKSTGQKISAELKEIEYVRLLLWGGAKKVSDNNTFFNAAKNVNADYTDVTGRLIEIKGGGKFIVDTINSNKKGSIQSIDFFTHGQENSLLFKLDEEGFYQELYINDEEEQKEGSILENDVKDKNKNGADISELDYNVFTKNAKIEIHGCNTGSITPENNGVNFASELSKHLYNAGKIKSVVIGHVDYANPSNHKTLKGSDYRHGGRRVYHNGKELFFTRKEGRIKANEINKHFN